MDISSWKFYDNNKSAYLIGAMHDQAKFVNVDVEINSMKCKCEELGLPFFAHSADAIEYLSKRSALSLTSQQ